ncbi:MAG: internal scaffolding protein [Microvirus sp.]|nr:MAG: internal scaffolding protein [Microvirus sp.]
MENTQMQKVNKHTGECPPVRCPESKRPFVRAPWCRERLREVNDEPSQTHTAHGVSVDVNHIVDRYTRDGYLPMQSRQPMYGDVTGLQGDLTQRLAEAEETIRRTEEFLAGYKPPEPAAKPPETPAEQQITT